MTEEEYEAHCIAKNEVVNGILEEKEKNDDDYVHVEKDIELLEDTDENRTTKRVRNQVIQTNGSNPYIQGPILAANGGGVNVVEANNTRDELMDVAESVANDPNDKNTKVDTMQNQGEHVVVSERHIVEMEW
ncbi:hypothetical protein C5167_004580 [Papaver somniferum]|uniref:Uncharacterized protein n=1 Tax=Papaver somniferum TaxID=3469 RepID=A0A4Y7J800_PAPSO|nr:hypothetical protein C5167_004580 [Papaver somniferum]